MKPGQVVRFRISPTDCLSVLDVLERAGVSTVGKSFNTVCHLAMVAMLESYRKANIIPREPDPFLFLKRMEAFEANKDHRQKMKIANTLSLSELRGNRQQAAAEVIGPEKMEGVKKRLSELDGRSESLTSEERLEYDRLCAILYP